jgi:hypothetical protein
MPICKMVEWSMGSVILAIIALCLSIAISPVVLSTLDQLRVSIRNFIRPSGNRCKHITRDDVSDHFLHNCGMWKLNPKYGHTDMAVGSDVTFSRDPPLCPNSLPSEFVNLKDPELGSFTKKPPELAYDTTYFKMDTWTLGAYLLHWQDALHWKDKIPHPRVDIQKVGDILVAKVVADRQEVPIRPLPTVCQLSKNDVDGILRGYPPFYRERLVTMNREKVIHPIRNVLDVQRGGWIVAIGLCMPFVVGKHRMTKPQLGPEESLAPLLYVVRPFKRIVEVLDNFVPAFGNQGNLLRVCEMATEIRTRKRSTTSRSEAWFFDSDVLVPYGGRDIESGSYLKDLTAKQCQTAMDAFNHYDPLSEDEIQILMSVLDKVLIAVLHGMFKAAEWDERAGILDYLEMTGLDTPTRVVYVAETYAVENA